MENQYWDLNECRWVHYVAPQPEAAAVPAQRADEPEPAVVPAP